MKRTLIISSLICCVKILANALSARRACMRISWRSYVESSRSNTAIFLSDGGRVSFDADRTHAVLRPEAPSPGTLIPGIRTSLLLVCKPVSLAHYHSSPASTDSEAWLRCPPCGRILRTRLSTNNMPSTVYSIRNANRLKYGEKK